MKKVTLIMFVFMLVVPWTTAFAASPSDGTVNLLLGKPFGSYTAWTDGDDTTGALLRPNLAIARYSFPSPVDISGYSMLMGSGYPELNKVFIYQGTVKTTIDFSKGGDKIRGVFQNLSISGVTRVEIQNVSTEGSLQAPMIYEFKLFGALPSNTDKDKFIVSNLKMQFLDEKHARLYWDAVDSVFFKQYKIYQDEVLKTSVTGNYYDFSDLEVGKTYVFKVAAVDTLDKEFSPTVFTYTVPLPDTIPPATPTNVQIVPDRYSAQVSWTASADDDVQGYFVYLNGTLLNATPTSATNFNITNLKLETDYTVSVAAVDTSGNLSPKTLAKSFKTLSLKTAPSQPTNLTAAAYNGAAALTWAPVQSAESYKVYQDGVNVMDVTSASVRVKSLQNGRQYKFAVSAVNEVGESKKSNEVAVTPSVKSVPDVSIGNGVTGVLTPISQSTGYWFENLWKLLAFTIGIPLAFYIGNRMKGLFIA